MACSNLAAAEPSRWMYAFRAEVCYPHPCIISWSYDGLLRSSFRQAYKALIEFNVDVRRDNKRSRSMHIMRFDCRGAGDGADCAQLQALDLTAADLGLAAVSRAAVGDGADFAVADWQALGLTAAELEQAQAEVWAELSAASGDGEL